MILKFLQNLNEPIRQTPTSYIDALLGKRKYDDKQSIDKELVEEADEDFNGFEVEKAQDGPRACSNFIVSNKEEEILNKLWRKTLVIKLLGRKISFRALELKLYQLWVKEGILEIINFSNDYHRVKFNSFYDYDFTLIRGPWPICDHYLTVCLQNSNFDLKEDEI